MKKSLYVLVITVVSMLIVSCSADKKYASAKLNSKDDTVSYYLGIAYGQGIKQAKIDSVFNYNAFMKGIKEAAKGDSLKVSEMEMQKYIQDYFRTLQEAQLKVEYKDYIAQNEAFLAANSRKDSVVTLPSGLQYQIVREGNGSKPTMNDKVKVHYIGKLIDGTVFDDSYSRKEPVEFMVGQVIQGWSEALQLMPVGSKWKIVVPQDLAYGGQARGTAIKPFSTLIFDVELLGIVTDK